MGSSTGGWLLPGTSSALRTTAREDAHALYQGPGALAGGACQPHRLEGSRSASFEASGQTDGLSGTASLLDIHSLDHTFAAAFGREGEPGSAFGLGRPLPVEVA